MAIVIISYLKKLFKISLSGLTPQVVIMRVINLSLGGINRILLWVPPTQKWILCHWLLGQGCSEHQHKLWGFWNVTPCLSFICGLFYNAVSNLDCSVKWHNKWQIRMWKKWLWRDWGKPQKLFSVGIICFWTKIWIWDFSNMKQEW
jgi:hypothetical protein